MKKKATKSFSKWLIAAVILSLLIIWPLFRQGYWESDDGEWMVIRFSAFHESLRDGHFPVRWTQRLNHHYGYPVFNFLYPLPFYLAEIPYLMGFGFATSVEMVFAASVILAAVGMFLFAKKWGRTAAFIATLVYVFAPYRIFLLYTRGSLGESVALACVPFLFYFADRVARRRGLRSILGMAVAFAALIMSHNVIALLFTPVLILYILKNLKTNLFATRNAISALLLGLSLSAFFWIPAFWDLQFTRAGEIRVSEYANYFLNTNELVAMLGLVALFFVFAGAVKRQWFFPAVSLVIGILMHSISRPLLEIFPAIEKIQFPWRLATVFLFAASASAGAAVGKMKFLKKYKKAVMIFTLLLLLLSVLPETGKVRFIDRQEGFYTTNDDTTTVKNEFTPIWVSEQPKEMPEQPYSIIGREGTYQILQEEFRTTKKFLQIRLNEPATITFNTHYFPGWNVYVDGQKAELSPSETGGLLKVEVTPSQNKLRDVKAIFEPTPVRKNSEMISLLTFLSIIIVGIYKGFPKGQRHKAVGLVSLFFAAASIGFFVFSNLHTYRAVFDPLRSEAAYLNSQWINPDSATNVPVGDHGIYSWAGWEYIHGKNPILINPEMPPLGKYIIGLGLILVKRPALVGFILALFAVLTHFALSEQILKNRWLAVTSTSLLLLEPVFRNLFNITMLDGLQIGFLNLVFLFFLKGLKQKQWFVPASLMLGAMASTKFYAAAALVTIALFVFLVLSKSWRQLKYFLVSLPLAGLVHVASYASFFAKGNSLRSYLGTQKWIFNFYRQGNVGTIPPGSYWLLVFMNRWRIWFGQEWGVFTTVTSDLWRVSWPLNVLAALYSLFLFVSKKLPAQFGVLLVWLVVYSTFLTFIIGWPHYMLLFLPYSYILLVELARRIAPILIQTGERWKAKKVF